MFLDFKSLYNPDFITLLSILSGCFIIQILYLCCIYDKLFGKKTRSQTNTHVLPPVSIVICIRDEISIIKKDVNVLLNQEYPVFEIIIVNMYSQEHDNFVFESWAKTIPNLTLVKINEKSNFSCSKIFPLSIGLKAAKYDTIILTDVNCLPTSIYWLRSMVSAQEEGQCNTAGIANYSKTKSFFNKFIRYEQNKYNLQFLSFLNINAAYTVSANNFLFNKKNFLNDEDLLHYYSINNDGTAILDKYINHNNTALVFSDYAQITINRKDNISSWWRNVSSRMSNNKFSKSLPKTVKFFYNFSLYTFVLSAIFSMIISNELLVIAAFLLVIRAIIWCFCTIKSLNLFSQRDLISGFWIYEPILWFLTPFLFLSSQKIRKRLWS